MAVLYHDDDALKEVFHGSFFQSNFYYKTVTLVQLRETAKFADGSWMSRNHENF